MGLGKGPSDHMQIVKVQQHNIIISSSSSSRRRKRRRSSSSSGSTLFAQACLTKVFSLVTVLQSSQSRIFFKYFFFHFHFHSLIKGDSKFVCKRYMCSCLKAD